ncbi:maleate cis-trans isomerase family protein [Capillimicrobium parvum]|uniref:Maleate isomerase n=1 Tax=Capillimicrobium parvum TaxID=2884022 RepID=A0A9E7C028_9ACTN|nr:Asp/Glu racemase [Capillimicrobium parvum]UGS35941.1 Maleate isomerase [Capillimicrobium parvum]
MTTRVGLIVPSSNTTIETEVPHMLRRHGEVTGERFTFHSSRAQLHQVDAESLDRMVADSDRCARELSDARVDALVYACLVAIMVRGHGAHESSEQHLAEVAAANGGAAPVVSSAGALIGAMEALGLQRVAIITPYLPELTAAVAGYIESYGITVTDAVSLGVADNVEVAGISEARLVEHARRLDTTAADGVVLSCCVQMPSLSAIAPVEAELGIPILSAATATVYQLLRALDRPPVVPGAGRLLSGEPVGAGGG